MRYTMKQIEVFLATAHHQNISLAAESLSMSQSAASESLKTLENQFDVKLFDRVGKRLQLNEFGNVIKKEAHSFIERASALEQTLRQHQKVGNVKVGATLSIGNYLAVNILSSFKARYPNATVVLEVANTTRISEKILNYELDIGLIEGEVTHPDLIVEPWRNDELIVFCAPSHPYASKRVLSDADLSAADWVLREKGSGTRQAFDYSLHGLLPELNVTLELQHTEAIKRAVDAGMGIGCLSRITLVDAFERGSLVPLSVPQRDFTRQFYFIHHKDKYISEGIKQWIALCHEFTV